MEFTHEGESGREMKTCLRIPVKPGQVFVKATIPTAVSSLLGIIISCSLSGGGECCSRRVSREGNKYIRHFFCIQRPVLQCGSHRSNDVGGK
jgi:hypothetical protein